LAENLINEVEDRLADLFSEGGDDEPKVETPPDVDTSPDFNDVGSDMDDPPILEEDNGDIEDSPLKELKSIVLSIDWEISDEIMTRFLNQVNGLMETYQDDRIIQMFLQLLSSVGKYIKAKKENSDPDVVKLLNSAYVGLEKVVLTEEISGDERKKLIIIEVNKFKKIREKLSGKPAAAKRVAPTSKEEVVGKPETGAEAAKEKTPVTVSEVQSKRLGFGSKFNLAVLLPLIIVVAAAYIYVRQLTRVPLQIDQMIQAYTGVPFEDAGNVVLAVLCGLVILIGLIASGYVHRLAGKVKTLTHVVERLVVGEDAPPIKFKPGDEIGALAEAIRHLSKS